MHPVLMGLGTATPNGVVTQARACALACEIAGYRGRIARFAEAVYAGAGVLRRGSVALAGVDPEAPVLREGENGHGPGTARRMDEFSRHAYALAGEACRKALAGARVSARNITHLVTVSCTGFAAPGVDHALISGLGLSPTVLRTNVGFMGCHGAINGLRVAEAFVRGDAASNVLLCCVELCSLHFQTEHREDAIVANALFADGAAAAVIGAASHQRDMPRIAGTASRVLPDSAGDMSWRIGDHGFRMTLSARVPDLVRAGLGDWLVGWLATHGLGLADVRGWAVHPGGPKVLDAVAGALELPGEAMDASRAVLAEHGNMSSATVLFVLRRMLEQKTAPTVLLAFGPGLTAEAALVL